MAPPKLNRTCSISGCSRRHAAHDLCLMHYKRVQRHGSPDYRWGGREVGAACKHCERPTVARGLCQRHYQMERKHGDALYADKRKRDGLPYGEHMRRGYRMVTDVREMIHAEVADATVERGDRHHRKGMDAQGMRGSGRRREWEHRKIVGAKRGQIVHHIDGNPLNNDRGNLHIFNSPSEHALAHRSLERIAYELLGRGLVEFDPQHGCYQLMRSSGPTRP